MLPKFVTVIFFALITTLLSGCGGMDPREVDVVLGDKKPTKKVTSFDKVLADLGKMSTIYGNDLRIQSEYIADNTGSSSDSKSGIPKDITEMTKSALNSIGGGVVYIPYNPSYVNNSMLTGYSGFENKLVPDVILSGGITEFDQNIETRSNDLDASIVTNPFSDDDSWIVDSTIEAGYNDSGRSELARITLDFNLVDFETLSGIAQVQTVNTMIVEKAVAEKELAFSLFGPTFGLSGSVTKAQGRHAAIRLLVQLSVAQIVGKYLMLPYWKLLPDAEPDQNVIDRILENHRGMSASDKIRVAQVSLFFLGHDISITGEMTPETVEILKLYDPSFDPSLNTIGSLLHLKLWESLADNITLSLDRQALLFRHIEEAEQARLEEEVETYPEQVTEDEVQNKPQPVEEVETEVTAPAPVPAKVPVPKEEVSVNNKVESKKTAGTNSSRKALPPKEQKAIREKASQDAVFRLLKKLSIWDEAK